MQTRDCKDVDAQFARKKPCVDCPFRNDGKALKLAEGRLESILGGLLSQADGTFHCHETVYKEGNENFDANGNYAPTEIHQCAGAASVMQKLGQDTQIVQVAMRMGIIKHDHYEKSHPLTIDPNALDREAIHKSISQRREEVVNQVKEKLLIR
ncbi:hypothetical protein ACFOY8_15035 [Thalassospira xianhensis]|uniref:hypothetical protein n=1 Tax=Thalassospira xianhensis TaxID=478503 RepID=UPI000DEDEDA9|nr:hypothetical protein [Thalassospira xianhensis]